MDWDNVLETLPINARPNTITALEFVTGKYNMRGDNDVFYEGYKVYNGVNVGSGLVLLLLLTGDDNDVIVPAATELQVKWD